MNIALIGAPGSGKTKFASDLEECLEGNVAIVDGYVEAIEAEADLAMGPLADYLGNLTVALGRWTRERQNRASHEITITCGTLIETAVYTAMHFEALSRSLSQEEQIEMAPRIDATLRMMACLYLDILDYDHAFYLPLGEPRDADAQFVDTQLQAALAGFKVLPVTVLSENRLQTALKALEGA